MLLYAVQSFAGIEEVSLYTMSQNWGETAYDNLTHTITVAEVSNWNKGRGWNFNWKYIDSNIASYTIDFGSATTQKIAIVVSYSYLSLIHI